MITIFENAYLKKRILNNKNSEVQEEYQKKLVKIRVISLSKNEINFYEGKFGKRVNLTIHTPSKLLKDIYAYDKLEYKGYEYSIIDIQEIPSSRKIGAKEYRMLLN